MLESNYVPLSSMETMAEREMSAFLRAAGDVAGQNSTWAGAVWLHSLELLECPDGNLEKFFRRVTILAISLLLADSDRAVRDEKTKPEGAMSQLTASEMAV